MKELNRAYQQEFIDQFNKRKKIIILVTTDFFLSILSQDTVITLAHGAGGTIMHKMIRSVILKHFNNVSGKMFEVPLDSLEDAGVAEGTVLTTDSYTVKPLFFPGGDIGRLAVAGTLNDIAVVGAEPIALSSALIIEEGFAMDDLEKIMESMKDTCEEAGGVSIITGDTKVVERGAVDSLIINTSAIGRKSEFLDGNISIIRKFRPSYDSTWLVDSNIRSGDKIIISGTVGDHGSAIMSARGNYGFESNIESDVRPLNKMISLALQIGGIVNIKDPTRGGLSNLLNEWSEKSHIGILLQEDKVPVKENVRSALGFLGLDAFELSNEGKVCFAVIAEMADEVLQAIRRTKEGSNAMIIGEATDEFDVVVLETAVGGRRIIRESAGDPVPRIC